jgi:NDP-sugar pyrophosphorylase family protein
MKAMILAAGEGTRLRPLTLHRPKPMLPIGGKPLLQHIVELLRYHGVVQVAINLHHWPEVITHAFGDGYDFGVEITYSFEDPILGTAGAVRKLQHYFDDTFIVFYGDVLTDLDITTLARYHRLKGGLVTIALYSVPNPSECGLVGLDPQGRVTCFVEKPPLEQVFTDLANAGILILEPDVINYIPSGIFQDFGYDVLPDLLAKGIPIFGYPIPDATYLVDIGTIEKYEKAQREWPRAHARDRTVDSGSRSHVFRGEEGVC